MAVGTVTGVASTTRTVCLLTGAIATSAVPTLATDGVACNSTSIMGAADTGLNFTQRAARECLLTVFSTAGSDVMSVTLRLWGYSATAGKWAPLGSGTDALKGVINAGVALGETSANTIAHSEPVYLAGLFDRLYLQVTAIGGTDTAVSAYLTTAITVGY
jgi:hypothetical protein